MAAKSVTAQPKRLTHAQRRARRERIASRVRQGRSIAAVAREFRVSLHTVRGACNEFGVDWRVP